MQTTLYRKIAIILICLASIFTIQIIINNRMTRIGSELIGLLVSSNFSKTITGKDILVDKAISRFKLYEQLINRFLLKQGMVVNVNLSNRQYTDVCDSLLFSNLRYTALVKLKMTEDAQKAWKAIGESRHHGKWVRHPDCASKSLSRDMLTGLLVALSQKPPGFSQHLKHLVRGLDQQSGYFSNGPAYVSYLTPGLGQIIRYLAPAASIVPDALPPLIKDGYSTNEFSVILIQRGYEAHLAALAIWLEMEITDHFEVNEKPGLIEHLFNAFVRPFSKGDLKSQRHAWTTQQLVDIDPQNMFFRYLRIRAAKSLTPEISLRLLQELVEMPQFPPNRLPMDCDRDADYLWQRPSEEYEPKSPLCNKQYSGVDFLWMAALLLENIEND